MKPNSDPRTFKPEAHHHLSADGLTKAVRMSFEGIDSLFPGVPRIAPADARMSAYAMFSLKAPSLLDFERTRTTEEHDLKSIYGMKTYFPPPVKAVAIPKKNGGQRILGIPTVADRVAQMVAKLTLEPAVEPIFLPDSYGYRPGKSALDAVGVTRERCWRYGWVLEFDIKGLFDNIDHELLLRAVRKHTERRWAILYIERWLKAPLQLADGTLVERTRGTLQGGAVSPVLASLFLHHAFDLWMGRAYPSTPWCRYADDGLVHCRTEQEAQTIKAALASRF